jgi:hypothetical protein
MRMTKLLALPLLSAVAALSSAQDPKPAADIHIPFPKFAPRPSATALLCTPAISVDVQGDNEADGNSAQIRALTYVDTAPARSYVKLKLEMQRALLSIGTLINGKVDYGPFWPYKVLSDKPEDYLAMREEDVQLMAAINSFALNRVTVTLITTYTLASLPQGAHPYSRMTFYTCTATSP